MNSGPLQSRRHLMSCLRAGLLAVSGLLLAGPPALTHAAEPLKIGIVGAGKMGGALAELWAKAGHEGMISSRHPDERKSQPQAIGPKWHGGTPRRPAGFGV